MFLKFEGVAVTRLKPVVAGLVQSVKNIVVISIMQSFQAQRLFIGLLP